MVSRRQVLTAAGVAAGAVTLGSGARAASTPLFRKAISIWAFPKQTKIADAVAGAKEHGFAGLELAFADDGEITMETTPDQMRALVRAARAAGITITSLATGLTWKHTLSHDDPAERAKADALVRKMLELASAAELDTILIIPGVVGRAMSPTMDVPYETVWKRSQAALKALAPEAARRKVVIGVENVWNRFLLSPLEMKRYLDELRSPWIKAYLDIGNVLRFGYPQDWVRTLGPLIRRVHIKDFNVEKNTFVDLMEGQMPWPEIVKAFGEVSYRGWWTAEVGRKGPDDTTLLARTSAAMDRMLAMPTA